ncbi:MAG: MoaD/ThiS family protein [Sedimenticola sp.]|nr:MoaD/ThiS family protein [Sedimenticola sp.]
MLYFTYLVKQLQKESEEVEIPASVTDVTLLIEWLRKRNRDQAHLFQEGSFQVTVNKQFSEPFTRIDEGDEVALIPTSPNAPVKK